MVDCTRKAHKNNTKILFGSYNSRKNINMKENQQKKYIYVLVITITVYQ